MEKYCLYSPLLLYIACFLTGMINAPLLANVNNSIHWPHDGDRVMKTHYEYVSVPVDTTVWDFSHVRETGDCHEMRWMNLGDSVLVCFEHGTQSIYRRQGDTLYWKGYENALFEVHDSIAPIATLTALHDDSDISAPMYFHGSYCANHAVDMAGLYSVAIGRTGRLILPNDTLNDILLVTTTRSCLVKVSSHKKQAPINENMDSLVREVEIINRWYSSSHRYPIVESINYCYHFANELLQENGITYLCSPDEQEYALGSIDAPNILLNYGLGRSMQVKHGGTPENISLADCITVSQSGNMIDVQLNRIGLAGEEVSALLCDIQGHVWSHQSAKANNGYWQCEINTSSLFPGHYLLHVMRGREKHVERIMIKQ